jgi:hypothetical protein
MASDYAGNYWSSYPNVAGPPNWATNNPNWATTNSAVTPMPQQEDPSITNSRRLLAALWVRWGRDLEPPFKHLHAYQSGDKVCLLVVTNNGQSTLLEDDSGSFPCDLLLTKLKLLAG